MLASIYKWLVLSVLICSLYLVLSTAKITALYSSPLDLHLTQGSYLPWARDNSKVYQELTLIDGPLNPHVIGYPIRIVLWQFLDKWYPAIAIHSGDITKVICSSPSRYLCTKRTPRMWHLQIKLSCLLLWDCLQILPSILPGSISSGNNSNLS